MYANRLSVQDLVGNAGMDEIEIELADREDALVPFDGPGGEELPGYAEWFDAAHAVKAEDIERMASHSRAERFGLNVYRLTCQSFPTVYEAARSMSAAWSKAIDRQCRGWARGGGEISVKLAWANPALASHVPARIAA
jgi:hypothetical protein